MTSVRHLFPPLIVNDTLNEYPNDLEQHMFLVWSSSVRFPGGTNQYSHIPTKLPTSLESTNLEENSSGAVVVHTALTHGGHEDGV